MLIPLPPGIVAAVYMMGFTLLDDCEVHMSSAFLAFSGGREIDWPTSSHESRSEDPYFPYEFHLDAERNLPSYSRLHRRRLANGAFSETNVVLRGATLVYSSQVSVPSSYEYCCKSTSVYCLRQDGVSPGNLPRTPDLYFTSESDRDAFLDDDWKIGEWNDATADLQ